MNNQAALMSSAYDAWNTPAWFTARIRNALGPIGLDPCSNESSTVPARKEFRLERGEDGLVLPWRGLGLVFVNPPYGRAIVEWMAKCGRDGDEVIALVPSRTDTGWFHDACSWCHALVLWRGRFVFSCNGVEKHPAPFPSAVFYRGGMAHEFLREFASDGFVAKEPK